jgi:hypothetical protein
MAADHRGHFYLRQRDVQRDKIAGLETGAYK